MVATTLHELDSWFQVAGLSLDRTNLLSKLATIELCGWIEGEFDRLIRLVAHGRISDASWVESDVIRNTYGFHYAKHWRGMLCKVVGEMFACRVEDAMEVAHPADLSHLKSLLGQLWTERCRLAHVDLTSNVAAAVTFSAPSLTISHYTILKRILSQYEAVMISVLPPLLAVPAPMIPEPVASTTVAPVPEVATPPLVSSCPA